MGRAYLGFDGAPRKVANPKPSYQTHPREETTSTEMPTDLYDLLEALEVTLAAADPAKRDALAKTIDAYAHDFPDEFYWGVSAQAPALLCHLLRTIDVACRPEVQTKPRPVIRLIDRKPGGDA